MIAINQYIKDFSILFKTLPEVKPWDLTKDLPAILLNMIAELDSDYAIKDNIAIHKTAVIERSAVIKAPAVIGENCFVGGNAYLRGGVYLASSVTVGTSCEIKSSIICANSAIAHFNFIGDSIIGHQVNFEAGSITANHHNDRSDKRIFVFYNASVLETDSQKFGSLVGDYSKIGANAVLSPGTLLLPNTIVRRLELVEQVL
ncbi:LbetaH domain-containing protein [Adhaeribacter pallidiroseus]|uniref:Mannose-1-phosphate guanylyltransferase n=1 Tax=Adhaeribacter pallidiroseus TaxID=2072847 RepID=A0A369QCW4_9BACT|nr:LpxA family transferase [Adhaeribacter pallidiroseus]RDC62180.1 Mannose-1-phosphate guanylyltransferase [Adhaeribacter pallidiroseus]